MMRVDKYTLYTIAAVVKKLIPEKFLFHTKILRQPCKRRTKSPVYLETFNFYCICYSIKTLLFPLYCSCICKINLMNPCNVFRFFFQPQTMKSNLTNQFFLPDKVLVSKIRWCCVILEPVHSFLTVFCTVCR